MIILFIVILLPGPVIAQNSTDSLISLLYNAKGKEKADILNKLSENFAFRDLQQAETYASTALRISDSVRYLKGRAAGIKNMGLIAYLSGDFIQAISLLDSSLNISKSNNFMQLTCDSYQLLGNTYEATNAYDRSLACFQKEYEFSRRLGDRNRMGLAMLNSGHVYRKMNQYPIAIESYRDAYRTFKNTDNESGIFKTILSMAKVFLEMNQMDSVRKYYRIAKNKIDPVDDPGNRIEFYMDKSIFLRRENPDSSIWYLEKAMPVARNAGRLYMLRDILRQLSDLYASNGEYQRAFDLHQQSGRLEDSINNNQIAGNVPLSGLSESGRPLTPEKNKSLPLNLNPYGLSLTLFAGGSIFLLFFVILWLYKKYHFEKKSLANIHKLEGEIITLTDKIRKMESQIIEFRENETKLKKQNQTLRQLLSGMEKDLSQLDQIREISRKIATGTGSEIISLWLYDRDHGKISCFNEYNRIRDMHKSGAEYFFGEYPLYFESLNNSLYIDADKCREDPRTMEFNRKRFVSREIFSRLDIPLKMKGVLEGVLCVERIGKIRPWSDEDRNFILSVRDILIQIMSSNLNFDSGKWFER